MIESCAQTGHRRKINSAVASAQSAFRLICAVESEIKTIVQMGALPWYSDRPKILPQSGAFALLQNLDWKRISNLGHASYFHSSYRVLAG